MKNRKDIEINPEEEAYFEALSYYNEFEEYIYKQNGRFFFGCDNKAVAPFIKELDSIIPNLEIKHNVGDTYFRARIVEGRTNIYHLQDGPFEAYSQDELSAPPPGKAKEGRINPRGVAYLYLAKTRPCALAEIRPPIGSQVAIGEGVLTKNIVVVSFTNIVWNKQNLFENSFVDLIGRLFSLPLNQQDAIEYMPTQVIAEYIRNMGYDGIEYLSSQYKSGLNLALFDINSWKADSAITFDVSDITYSATRNKGLVDLFGYKDDVL